MTTVPHLARLAWAIRLDLRTALWALRGRWQDRVTLRTRHGKLTIATRDSAIGRGLYVEGQVEYEWSRLALAFLKAGGFVPPRDVTMLDVGANIGFIGTGLLLAGDVDRVVAVEPEPANGRLLAENIRQNGLSDRMVAVPVAAGEKASTAVMEISPDNPGDHRIRTAPLAGAPGTMGEALRRTIEVPVLTLPEILRRPEVARLGATRPSLLWIDVQGYEGYVFEGARELLGGGLPTVAEIWPYGMLRAGMSPERFHAVVRSLWSDYWVERRGRLTRYPTQVFDRYLDEIGADGHFENVVFTGPSRP